MRHGMLTKRSISKSKTTFNARFQERWFILTDRTLSYHTPNGSTVRQSDDFLPCFPLPQPCGSVDKSRVFTVFTSLIIRSPHQFLQEKGRISVNCIRCCEPVMEETFNRQRMFQVSNSDIFLRFQDFHLYSLIPSRSGSLCMFLLAYFLLCIFLQLLIIFCQCVCSMRAVALPPDTPCLRLCTRTKGS